MNWKRLFVASDREYEIASKIPGTQAWVMEGAKKDARGETPLGRIIYRLMGKSPPSPDGRQPATRQTPSQHCLTK